MQTHPLEILMLNYLDEKDITIGTRALYQTILKQYANYLKYTQITHPKTKDVLAYLDMIKYKGYSDNWLRHQITVIKGMYQYLSLNYKCLSLDVSYGIDISSPIQNISVTKFLSKLTLTKAEAKHLILYLKHNRQFIWHYRDYAIIFLMLTTGLRSIEIRRAKIKDLKILHGHKVLFIQGKGRDYADSFVKLPDGVYVAIKDYLNKRLDQSPHLFVSKGKNTKSMLSRPNFIYIIKRVLKHSGLEHTKITAHSLRHTAATFNRNSGGSMKETKDFLRHSHMSSTRIYTKDAQITDDDSILKLENFILNEKD